MDLNTFHSTIANIVKEVIASLNISINYFGTVVAVSDSNKRATVRLSGESNVVDLLNKTGETLSVGDGVVIEAINGKLSNGNIKTRFGEANNV